MIIIGIDPGTASTGYGIIKRKGGKDIECLGYGLIKTEPTSSPADRLKKLSNEFNGLIKKYNPDVLAIENIYFFKNSKTVISVSQAKGVILLGAAKKKISIYEFAPLHVKMIITGDGRAKKKQMQQTIQKILALEKIPKPDDAADALSVAVCCANNFRPVKNLYPKKVKSA